MYKLFGGSMQISHSLTRVDQEASQTTLNNYAPRIYTKRGGTDAYFSLAKWTTHCTYSVRA